MTLNVGKLQCFNPQRVLSICEQQVMFHSTLASDIMISACLPPFSSHQPSLSVAFLNLMDYLLSSFWLEVEEAEEMVGGYSECRVGLRTQVQIPTPRVRGRDKQVLRSDDQTRL